ncbi:type IV pilus modification protein PilV [Endozoicomonas ascidiicola]|uniref:type IV pilus modification protein PilV n=1 Tax=Endozoicomonas ascidiicola TaxID=1698521 RepID=UPI00083348C7|nr:type IV pilus modification protein PilV [Endozoicomonas ascidiicola]
MIRKKHSIPALGFTLIEVMIAVLILAVGLFGVSSLTSRSISYNQNAYFTSVANALAYDMLDRIKANTAHSVDGPGYAVSLGSIPSSYPTNCEGASADCDPRTMATYDINQWKFMLSEQLPDGDGTIVVTNRPEGRLYTITIFYDDSKRVRARRQIVVEGGV